MNLGSASNPVELTKKNVVSFVKDCKKVLSEQSVKGPYWVRLPEWLSDYLAFSEWWDAKHGKRNRHNRYLAFAAWKAGRQELRTKLPEVRR
jgi:hypothetical protein